MNYEREIHAFYDWLETNTLTDSAIVLWHALMHTAHRAGWPGEFAVAISVLNQKTGLKKDAINRARHRLQQAQRIEFKSRTGQLSAIYRMVPFEIETQKTTQTASQEDRDAKNDTNRDADRSQTASIGATQTASINKDFITTTTTTVPEGMTIMDAYTKVFGMLQMNGLMSDYVKSLLELGCSENFVVELLLESGEAGNKPSLRHIQTIADRWLREGIHSRKEAKREKTPAPPSKDKFSLLDQLALEGMP